MSRRKSLDELGIVPDMPEIEWGQYLISWLFEVGPTMAAGMGEGPLTASEIISWERLLGIQFRPWEARLLRRLSMSYASESSMASKRDRPAPFVDSTDAARIRQIQMQRELDVFLS